MKVFGQDWLFVIHDMNGSEFMEIWIGEIFIKSQNIYIWNFENEIEVFFLWSLKSESAWNL